MAKESLLSGGDMAELEKTGNLYLIEDNALKILGFSELMPCDCEDWRSIKQLDGIIMFAHKPGKLYCGGQFVYCPWCGKKRKGYE